MKYDSDSLEEGGRFSLESTENNNIDDNGDQSQDNREMGGSDSWNSKTCTEVRTEQAQFSLSDSVEKQEENNLSDNEDEAQDEEEKVKRENENEYTYTLCAFFSDGIVRSWSAVI